ncbi:MAG: hypothetical protein HY320_03600 [Armatimonadetes bacterium]|nr:hypothetical protein [Armatimonadota bacterium]
MAQRKRRLRLRARHVTATGQVAAPPAAEPEPEASPPVAAFHTRGARLVYWVVFAGAAFALSQFLESSGLGKALHGGRSEVSLATALLVGGPWLILLVAAVFVLGLFVYERERARGKVKHPVRVYERLLARWEGSNR